MGDLTGKLKDGWQLVKFGDVVRQVKDKVDPDAAGLGRYIAGEHMDTDDLKIRRWGEIGTDYTGPANEEPKNDWRNKYSVQMLR